jgi:hypothetical protein
MNMRTQWRSEIEGKVEELVEATMEDASRPVPVETQADATAAVEDDSIPF